MFITDRLIYLQMPKTGCTQIAYLLSKCVGGTEIGKHEGLRDYKTEKKIVGSVRNPWDWYVSLWAYGCSREGALYERLTKRYHHNMIFRNPKLYLMDIKNNFRKPIDHWKRAYQTYKDPSCFKKWLKLIYNQQRKRDLGEGYADSSISTFSGFMTYRYCKLHMRDFLLEKNLNRIRNIKELNDFDSKHNILDYIIKTESLEDDLIHVLQQVGYNLDEAKIKFIFDSGINRLVKSKHHDAGCYYDEETLNLVKKKEKFIIDKYGYKPPLSHARDN